MPRYWVIAPYSAEHPESWERVWEFDLANNVISIGWSNFGDASGMDEPSLKAAIEQAMPDRSTAGKNYVFRAVWAFYHLIEPGDIVVARRGLKVLAGVGTVIRKGYYDKDKNSLKLKFKLSSHIDVKWESSPRDKKFSNQVFGMATLYEISKEEYETFTGSVDVRPPPPVEVENPVEFTMEKYLEEFIVSNFDKIFNGKYILYTDPEEDLTGQQFRTDVGVIDILALEPATNSYVVIELKKGQPSDKVVGQVLKYMGWVAEKLCDKGQGVKGMVICREQDEKLSLALKMTPNVAVKYYRPDFKLLDGETI